MSIRLAHLHLPSPISYAHSLRLQEAVLERNFAYTHALLETSRTLTSSPSSSSRPPPYPVLLTFQTHPTYTVGRRHLKTNPLSQSQIDFLTSSSTQTSSSPTRSSQSTRQYDATTLATFYPSPRGGLLTYHAPGQLTAYLIYNLRAYGITPRCHIRVLENAVIRTCARHGVPNTLITQDPGVWIGESTTTTIGSNATQSEIRDRIATDQNYPTSSYANDTTSQCGTTTYPPNNESFTATNRKICAVGVHVSRGITSHGIGLNVHDATIASPLAQLYKLPISSSTSSTTTQPPPDGIKSHPESQREKGTPLSFQPQESTTIAPGYLSWGFSRIIACGLEGKTVTWLSREASLGTNSTSNSESGSISGFEPNSLVGSIEAVSTSLAEEICRGMTKQGNIVIEGVDRIKEDEILGDWGKA